MEGSFPGGRRCSGGLVFLPAEVVCPCPPPGGRRWVGAVCAVDLEAWSVPHAIHRCTFGGGPPFTVALGAAARGGREGCDRAALVPSLGRPHLGNLYVCFITSMSGPHGVKHRIDK